jgi:hypothetical protein
MKDGCATGRTPKNAAQLSSPPENAAQLSTKLADDDLLAVSLDACLSSLANNTNSNKNERRQKLGAVHVSLFTAVSTVLTVVHTVLTAASIVNMVLCACMCAILGSFVCG